jgi:hypothetical protein
MIRDTARLPSENEVQARKELRTAPIEFDWPFQAGVSEKNGAWYVIHRLNALPDHIQAQISLIQSSRICQNSVTMIKFLRGVKSARRQVRT